MIDYAILHDGNRPEMYKKKHDLNSNTVLPSENCDSEICAMELSISACLFIYFVKTWALKVY